MDVDLPALEKARRAVYHPNSFRSIRAPLVEKHFVKEPGGARVRDAIRKLVRFRQGNLVEPASYEGLAPLDVIFCRNVLIYFSDATILKVVRLFHQVLHPGGYLFLGHAESLSRITDLFTPIRFQGAMVYQKTDGAGSRPAAAS
jgi:chemotaxis protein methyltransferase CheR